MNRKAGRSQREYRLRKRWKSSRDKIHSPDFFEDTNIRLLVNFSACADALRKVFKKLTCSNVRDYNKAFQKGPFPLTHKIAPSRDFVYHALYAIPIHDSLYAHTHHFAFSR